MVAMHLPLHFFISAFQGHYNVENINFHAKFLCTRAKLTSRLLKRIGITTMKTIHNMYDTSGNGSPGTSSSDASDD